MTRLHSPDPYVRLGELFASAAIGARGKDHSAAIEGVTVVVNPKAGALCTRKRAAGVLHEVEGAMVSDGAPVASGARRSDESTTDRRFVHVTTAPGDAGTVARELCAQSERTGDRVLLISLGGDGTHGEILNGIVDSRAVADGRIVVHRVPLGTGNDGADAHSVDASLFALLQGGEVRWAPGLRVTTAAGRSRVAFNVASLGLDAFVSILTNHVKRRLPGDSYKLFADIATLLYEPLFGAPTLRLAYSKGAMPRSTAEGQFMLCAIGASGYRSYGRGKPILPDSGNLCAIRRVNLREKLKIKRALYAGTHLENAAVLAATVGEIEVACDRPLPVQLDGEAEWFPVEALPVRFTVLPHAVRALRLDNAARRRTDSGI